MDPVVLYTIRDNIAEIELNRRECKNALDASMYYLLADTLERAERDPEVRVILVRGQEDMFCAGNDLKDFADETGQGTKPALTLMDVVQSLKKPLIAAVAGPAVGIGTTLLYHCDVVYAADNATFGMPFVALGVCPEFGSSRLAPLAAGYRAAAEAILFAEPFDVEYALRAGIVSRILPVRELFAHTRARAVKLAKMPSAAVLQSKSLMRSHIFRDMSSVFREELSVFDTLLKSEDSRRAIGSFLSRRKS